MLGWIYSRNILLCENYVNQPATFFKKELWEAIGDMNPAYKAAWDYEQWLKMAGRSRAISIHRTLSNFRRHDQSISENHFEKQFDEELKIAREHGNFIHYLIHTFNKYKIIFVYKLLSK